MHHPSGMSSNSQWLQPEETLPTVAASCGMCASASAPAAPVKQVYGEELGVERVDMEKQWAADNTVGQKEFLQWDCQGRGFTMCTEHPLMGNDGNPTRNDCLQSNDVQA